VTAGDGQLQGELEARDQLIAGEIQSVNGVATRVINSVNALHESGTDINGNPGIPFFTGKDATDIAVNSTLTGSNGTDYVAASRPYQTGGSPAYASAPGDNSNAIAIADLANSEAQLDSTSPLQQGSTVGTGTVTALSVAGATASSTYAYSWDSTNNTLSVSVNGGSPSAITATMVPSGSGQMVTVDGQGVRIALQVPNGTTLNAALSAMNNQSVTTAANPSTVGDQYAQFVAALGVDSSTAQGQSDNEAVLVNHLQQQRESVSGVSLDEEATNLIQYQRSYQAAARVVTVMDSMLDTLINHTGLGS
jgi:flagellar hook-associated protein 1 FlgK